MRPARAPRDGARLLALDRRDGRLRDHEFSALPQLLAPGDVLVVNDAGTLPGSLRARALLDGRAGEAVELRLLGPPDRGLWTAALLGRGDWRTPTERRPPPPPLPAGARLRLEGPRGAGARRGGALELVIERRVPTSPRLVELRFLAEEARVWTCLYEHGEPVQYAHVARPLRLAEVQTRYASRPWAAEMPSAGRPLTAAILLALRRRGVALASLTHAAGLSSIGDAELDAVLPLPERYDIPARTVTLVEAARARGGRVIAVGTTVVRALEGATREAGRLEAGAGVTGLVIGPGFAPRCVDGLLTGMHAPGESHYELLRAFVRRPWLDAAIAHAERAGYRNHEFGDTCLIGPDVVAARARPSAA